MKTKKDDKQVVSKKTNDNKKKFPVKNLPSIFRKKLDEKKFDKKIISKIYIPQDKDYISSLYKKTTENDKVFYAIPADSQFTKTDLSRLKVLAGVKNFLHRNTARRAIKNSGIYRTIPQTNEPITIELLNLVNATNGMPKSFM